MKIERSNRAEVRNPVLTLPSFAALRAHPAAAELAQLLVDLQADCRDRAEKCWKKKKPPMAAYWAAVGVWAGHIARALKKGTRDAA